jgi:peptidoglycan/LPS O-acetylase OafA/YrhL
MGVVRLFLALVVAADHWRATQFANFTVQMSDLSKSGFNAGYAVLFFYVISGFLISYTLSRNYTADLAGVCTFYRARFARIFSLYWPVVILTFLILSGAWRQFVSADFWDQVTGLFLLGQDWRLCFASYPEEHWGATIPYFRQSWTLALELTFYLAAPFLLRSFTAALLLLLASFLTRFVLSVELNTPAVEGIWLYYFVGTTFGFFLLGHFAFRAGRRWPLLSSPWLGCGLLIASFVAMAFGGSYAIFDGRRLWSSILLFTMALPGLFEATRRLRWMNALGELSYPVYLIHSLTLIFIAPYIWTNMTIAAVDDAYLSTLLFLVFTVAMAFLAHWLIEVPVAGLMRSGLPRRRTA